VANSADGVLVKVRLVASNGRNRLWFMARLWRSANRRMSFNRHWLL